MNTTLHQTSAVRRVPTPEAFLAECQRRGIRLTAEDSKIKASGRPPTNPSKFHAYLIAKKPELLALLRASSVGQERENQARVDPAPGGAQSAPTPHAADNFPPVTPPPALSEGRDAWHAWVESQMPRARYEASLEEPPIPPWSPGAAPWSDAQEEDLLALGREVEQAFSTTPGAWRDADRVAGEKLWYGVASETIRGHWTKLPIRLPTGSAVRDPKRWLGATYDKYQILWWQCEHAEPSTRKTSLEEYRERLFKDALHVLLAADWFEREVPSEVKA